MVLIGGLLLYILYDKPLARGSRTWAEYLVASLLFTAFVYFIATYSTEISDYPFALHWSETSRYYYASLFLPEYVMEGLKEYNWDIHTDQVIAWEESEKELEPGHVDTGRFLVTPDKKSSNDE